MNEALQVVALLSLAVVGTAVVLARDPVRQALVLGVFGFVLVIVFFALQAPDVALSAIVVSAVGLPPMVLLALRKIREYEREEEGDEP